MPFIFLSFTESTTVWQSVYYYGIVTTLSSLVFFASPAKKIFTKKLQARSAHVQKKQPVPVPDAAGTGATTPTTPGTDGHDRDQALGLPADPGKDLDEAVEEIKGEIGARNRRGSTVTMPSGEELKAAVEERIGRKP